MMVLADGDASFMIKLLYKYTLFGQDFYLTTTHVAMLIITVVLIIFLVAANRAIKKALAEESPRKPGG